MGNDRIISEKNVQIDDEERRMVESKDISVTLTPLQVEYLQKMEQLGYSIQEIIHRAINDLIDKSESTEVNYLSNKTKIVLPPAAMIFVEGGSFCPIASFTVKISSFYIGKYPVTQAEYRAVMGFNPAHDYGVGADYPVYYVSWFNAIEYCNRRSIMEGLKPCYSYGSQGTDPDKWQKAWDMEKNNHLQVNCDWDADGYRLPTEMEWMFSARGGLKSGNCLFSGSNDIDSVGWHRGNWGEENYSSHSVGAKAPNELGIYDMSGNVWELVWDIFGAYPSGEITDPKGAETGTPRVRRGGGWYFSASVCSVSTRSDTEAANSGGSMGFRICRR